MTALFIILGIVLTLRLLLCIRGHVRITAKDDLKVTLRILFIKIPIHPKKASPKKLLSKENGDRKSKSKKEKKAIKIAKQAQNATSDKAKKKKSFSSLLRTIKLIGGILWKIRKTFPEHLRLTVSRFIVRVGGEDAAQAAIKYGAVSAAASFVFGAAEKFVDVKVPRKGQVLVTPDYLSPDFSYDIDLSISISVRSLLSLAIRLLHSYLCATRAEKKKNKTTNKTNSEQNTPADETRGA